MAGRTLTIAQARRVALAAQGFADPQPEPWAATMRHVQRVIDRVQVVQIDSVNVVSRSHYLPFLARLGPYDRDLVDRACSRAPRRLVESCGAHGEPRPAPSTWPLLDFRMRRADQEAWGGAQSVRREFPGLVDAVLDEVERRGPLTSREAEVALAHDAPQPRPLGLELVGRQDLARAALPFRPAQLGRPHQPVRTPVCVAGYCRAGVGPGPLARPEPPAERGGRGSSSWVRRSRRLRTVWCDRPLPCATDFRLKSVQVRPAIARLVETGALRSRHHRRLGQAGLVARRGPHPTAGARGSAAPARSTPWSGSANAPRRSTTCATGSRSTRRRTSGSTATTCSRSSTATTSSRGSTSRPTAPPASCDSTRSPGSPAHRARPALRCCATSRRWPTGSAWTTGSSRRCRRDGAGTRRPTRRPSSRSSRHTGPASTCWSSSRASSPR